MMGNYLSTTKLVTRMGQSFIEDLTGLSGAGLTTELAAIIARCEGVVDGHCGVHYDVPLTGTEGIALAEHWTFTIAQWDLHMRGAGDRLQEKIQTAYSDTMKQLRAIAAGDQTIPGEEAPSGETKGLVIDSNDIVFDWDDDAEDTY